MTNEETLKLAAAFGLSNETLGYPDFEKLLLEFLATLLVAEEKEKCRFAGECALKGKTYAGNC